MSRVGEVHSSRWVYWARLLVVAGSAQTAIQVLGFLAGILVIRMLPQSQYALYTLGNTMLGTITLLADGGLSTGVMAQGGRVWADRARLGAVIATGMALRRKFAMFTLFSSVPVLVVLLHMHGASWLAIAAIVFALIAAFMAALSGPILEIGPKLHQDIAPLQKIQVLASAGRLTLLTATMAWPSAALAILCAALSQWWTNWRLRLLAGKYFDAGQPPDVAARKEILAVVKRILPVSIYYCISGQLTVWLVSIFGSTTALAQIGALSRLAVALSLLSTLVNVLVLPRFVRLPHRPALLLSRYFQVLGGLALVCALIVTGAWLLPAQLLWVLGDDYSGLTEEVVLAVGGGCLGVLTGAAYLMCAQRGHVLRSSLNIGAYLCSLVVMLAFFDYSSVRSWLWYAIANHAIHLLLWAGYFVLTVSDRSQSRDRPTTGGDV